MARTGQMMEVDENALSSDTDDDQTQEMKEKVLKSIFHRMRGIEIYIYIYPYCLLLLAMSNSD